MAVSYARGVLVSKSLTLPKGVHDGFLPVNKKKKPREVAFDHVMREKQKLS
jgi:hypothetical protein